MSFKLSEGLVDQLLDKLGSDDAFRSQFQSDPRAAMASLGFAPAADSKVGAREGLWACCSVSALASKEQIRGSRQALRSQLLSAQASLNPIHLEAPKA
jgi:putative modified peptide